MRPRSVLLNVCILAVALSLGGGSRSLWAQDRGAPRFRPTPPPDTVEAEASDAGRLWSVAAPPLDRFEKRYGLKADSAWATHLRRGVLRLPGCTAGLVSDQGLALTTARCVRRHLEAGAAEEVVLARQPAEERSVPGLYADHLRRASDVTAEVQAAKKEQGGSVERAMQRVRERLQADVEGNRRVEVRSVAGGARFMAYVYRRYDDVRLAFLPERALSAFGGVDAAMAYPRSALDVALLRVYTSEGEPFEPKHFFETRSQGIRPGNPVFSVGHSTETRRTASADQLAFRRDVVLPRRHALLGRWTDATQAYLDTARQAEERWTAALAKGRRTQKRTRARLSALRNDYVMTRLRRRDAQFRRALQQDPVLQRRFGGVLDSLAALQAAKRALDSAYRAFGGLESWTYHSSTLRRALVAHRTLEAGAGQRDSLWRHLLEVPSQPAPVDAAMLTAQLEALREYLQPDTTAVRQLLNGASLAERAASVVETSVLSHADRLRSLQEKGAGVLDHDPALALVEAFAARYRSFRKEWRTLTRAERELTRRLARARVEVSTPPVLPAQSGAPRLTDGRLLGYPYNGTSAPPLTTFYGLYSRSRSFGEEGTWALPEEWNPSPEGLDRSVPLNLAVSTDGAAGTNGAPLLNQYLEIVGVTIGTNIQGVAGAYLFLPERMRTVAVDLRGLRQALTNVFEGESLAEELFGGPPDSDETSP